MQREKVVEKILDLSSIGEWVNSNFCPEQPKNDNNSRNSPVKSKEVKRVLLVLLNLTGLKNYLRLNYDLSLP